jgi:RNA polymerase sigma-70 factor (ECF subfamily)
MEPQGIALPVTVYQSDRSNDLAAFERIMARSERRVLRVALRLLNNQQDAQDAAQEVFLRLYKHLDRLDLDDARGCEPWLFRVTVNVCRDMARKRGRWVVLEDAGLEDAAMEDAALQHLPAAPSDAQHSVERAQQLELVRRALGRLGEKERAALVLRDVEGLSTPEVAAILGSSEATVRSQISTARLKVRDFTSRLLRRRS